MKISVGNNTYNLTKYDKIQITDTTLIIYPNTGGYLLQNWVIKFNDKNISGKIQSFLRSTRTSSPTGNSGATSLPPIGSAFLYIEMSANNYGSDNIFCSFERIDIIQNTNINFYYKRFSFLTNNLVKAMGRY